MRWAVRAASTEAHCTAVGTVEARGLVGTLARGDRTLAQRRVRPSPWGHRPNSLALTDGLIGMAWLRARPSGVSISPWEQGLTLHELPRKAGPATLNDARKTFGLDQPAIKVASSQGDHQARFSWNAEAEEDLCKQLLDGLASRAP